jgi:PhnB protein
VGAAQASIIPNLSVRNGREAVTFYQAAFGATVDFQVGDDDGPIFAALRIMGARVFVADATPEHGNLSPDLLGGTSVRINLHSPDPEAVHARAVAAGATEISPVRDEEAGPPMGVVRDPFGHTWLIGAPWDPASPDPASGE